jgi:hypothetical protein
MRSSLAAAVGVAIVAALAPAAGAQQFNEQCGAVACRVEERPIAWEVVSYDAEERRLEIAWESGGCHRGEPRVVVRERPTRVEISVLQDEVVAHDLPDPRPVCPAILRAGVVQARLRAALDGRPLAGEPRIARPTFRFPRPVPAVVDLAFADAAAALRGQGFTVRRIGPRSGPVLFQRPLPGKAAPGRRVTLTVGRWFRDRALRRCLGRAGIRSTALRPDAGDLDAPDLELVLDLATSDRRRPAFVGFYADRRRGAEIAPSILRRARRAGLAVERRRHVTIIWPPDSAASERGAVRRCVYGPPGRRRLADA